VGMLTLLCIVVVFGAHSLIDWTWYVPGVACVALLCAGWLVGRAEPGAQQRGASARARMAWSRVRIAAAGAVALAALLSTWAQWQPQRAEESRAQALALAEQGRLWAAQGAARSAVSRDPLSAEALFALADLQQASGDPTLARATLQRAVRLQPSNPNTWLELARHDLTRSPRAALTELQAAIFLNPQSIAQEAISGPAAQRESIEIYNDYIQVLRANGMGSASS